MKLIIFGAAGGIGRQVVENGLKDGHQVTAVLRRPNALNLEHPNLTVIKGDVMDPATVSAALRGQEVAVSTVGVHDRAPTTVYSAAATHILCAMQSAGLRRFFCISATGLEPGPFIQRVLAKPLLWWAFKESYLDLVRMETAVKASNLDWTIIRPPRLTDGPRTGHYNVAINQHVPGAWLLSRADVADYILTHLKDSESYRGIVEVAY